MNSRTNPLENLLFPKEYDDSQEAIRLQLLEQYKLFVQTSESLVSRRQTVNTFFLSINSALLASIGILGRELLAIYFGGVVLLILGITGFILCIAWRRLVNSYRQLNTAKFQIIHLLEERLPASLFKAEWKALGEGKDKKKYNPFTKIEAMIPIIFCVLYGGCLLVGSLILLKIVKW